MSEWATERLAKVLTLAKAGGTPSTSNDWHYGGAIPFVTIEDITSSQKWVTQTKKTLSKDGLRSCSAWLVEKGDLLYSMYATLGKVRLAGLPLCTNQAIIALRPDSRKMLPQYLYYYLEHLEHEITRLAAQTTQANLNAQIVKSLPIRYPVQLAEQRRIADLLSAVDEEIAQTERILEKQALFRNAVIRDALARLAGAPLKPLEKLAEVGSGVTLGRQFFGPGTTVYPYLRVANVQDGHIDLTEVKSLRLPEAIAAKAKLEPGDVLMNEGGDFDKLGRGAVWRGQIPSCLHQNHVFRVRCNQELLLPEFLALWAASDFGKQFFMRASKQSTNLASINSTQLKQFPVLCPALDEQKEVLRIADALDSVIELGKQEVVKLRLWKEGLAQDLFASNTEHSASTTSYRENSQ